MDPSARSQKPHPHIIAPDRFVVIGHRLWIIDREIQQPPGERVLSRLLGRGTSREFRLLIPGDRKAQPRFQRRIVGTACQVAPLVN